MELSPYLPTGPEFELREKAFFEKLGEEVKPALDLHEINGLWDVNDSWHNVTEHCMLQVARVETMADMVGLSDEVRQDLAMAAAVHDAYKKREVSALKENDFSWQSYMESQQDFIAQLEESGFKPQLIEIIQSIGHDSITDMWNILQKTYQNPEGLSSLTELEKAKIIMHYSDDFTIDAGWAEWKELDVDIDGYSGTVFSPLEQRMILNEQNPRYRNINKAGKSDMGGARRYIAQLSVGREIERLIADLINLNTDKIVNEDGLPMLIDQLIAERIAEVT